MKIENAKIHPKKHTYQTKEKKKICISGDRDCWTGIDSETWNFSLWKVSWVFHSCNLVYLRHLQNIAISPADFSQYMFWTWPICDNIISRSICDNIISRSACHLQLGRDLYDRKKFGKEVNTSDFADLLDFNSGYLFVLKCFEGFHPTSWVWSCFS